MKKSNALILAVMTAACILSVSGCRDTLIVEIIQYSECHQDNGNPSGGQDDQDGQDDSGLGNNLVGFHASVESLNLATRSMSPIGTGTRVMIYAFHGSTDDATSTSAVARGFYTAKQTAADQRHFRLLCHIHQHDRLPACLLERDLPCAEKRSRLSVVERRQL